MGYMNFFAAKLLNDIGSGDTTITLDTAPSATSGRMVLEARNPTQREVIKYTGVTGTQLTGVTRGQGGTTAKSHTQNSLIEMNLTSEDISDLYNAFASFSASVDNWHNLPYTVGTVTALGNNSFNLNVNSTDITSIISNGMRVRATRTVAAPNTAFSLDGSNDYYVKTSPNKLTFTDDFVCSAWVYLTSYASATIVSRYNGTSGWELSLLSDGRVIMSGYNAGAANTRNVVSYQSLPLNRWVHVAGQLDMSAHTATTTTSYVMLDGVDVPAQVTQGGTNPTALIQAGNLEIGSRNGGTNPFPGYLDQVAVYSAKVTQATILASINRALTGSETSLASAYSNGSVNDLNTTTPNNLTATNGATTVANSPFGNRGVSTTLEYGVIMANSFSTNTTLTIQVPEGCQLPTTGGITTLDYANVEVPYRFPRDKSRFQIAMLIRTLLDYGAATAGTWYNLFGLNMKIPTGAWMLSGAGPIQTSTGSGGTYKLAQLNVNKTAASVAGAEDAWGAGAGIPALDSAGTFTILPVGRTNTTLTTYYINILSSTNSNNLFILGDRGTFRILFENAYI